MKMDDLTLISKGLYRHVNWIVGFEDVVRMRRMVMDLEHEIKNVEYDFNPAWEVEYLSGSEAEGLRFSSSDRDIMYIIRDVRVLFSLSQLSCYNNNTTLLLAECDRVRPGFALLRLVTGSNNYLIMDSSVGHGNRCYVASSLWRSQITLNQSYHKVHGPCLNIKVANWEFDRAFCIKSDIWPEAALGCIRRMREVGWPKRNVISNIVKEGCLFVPIGSRNSNAEEYEWRLSFSLAEKTLIHNMTHTQFLTYGLLKIFLKEAINLNCSEDGLLCSYFLKTILFWKATQPGEWSENNFLLNFWVCFQTLIQYVNWAYCPNFFIPENNMFRGKIEGVAQQKLLSHLTSLYRFGYRCLLQCPSVREVMLVIIEEPVLAMMIPGDDVSSRKAVIDIHLAREIWNRCPCMENSKQLNLAKLHRMETLLSRCSSVGTTYEHVMKSWKNMLLQDILLAETKQTTQMYSLSKEKYYITRRCITLVSMSSVCDIGRHLLYLAIALYHLWDFTSVIRILLEVKTLLQHPCLMYPWKIGVNMYRAAGGDTMPLSDMMKTVIAFPVSSLLITCIPGLELEHEAALRYSTHTFSIPPLVCANYLLFLCHRYNHDTVRANAVLDELSTLVHCDDGHHIYRISRAVCWQLLGICQEINGDYQRAFISYNTAKQQKWCSIKLASELRISNMCSYLASSHI